MPYIKKLYLDGFKSFAKPTTIIFEKGLNCIVGPNGSGKSNLVEAICFVLGRLKVKSLRASKASNLIYHGGTNDKPAKTATVSIVFDNSDNVFVLPEPCKEVEITRIVRRDGTSIYKINGKTKTRQEVLELLAQAGIDPEGFNIILQAEIDKLIRLHPEEKRQIIEEIAGISIYEKRKEKALNELEKTEAKLKEVKTILNERSAYMKNLEKEKKQAEMYEKLKEEIRKDKAALIFKQIFEKKKEIEKLLENIEERKKLADKTKESIDVFKEKISRIDEEIQKINEEIERQSGIEQEKLIKLRSEVAVLNVKLSHSKDQLENVEKRIEQLKKDKEAITKKIESLEKSKKEENFKYVSVGSFRKEIIRIANTLKESWNRINGTLKEFLNNIKEKNFAIESFIKENSLEKAAEEIKKMISYIDSISKNLNEEIKKAALMIEEARRLKISEEKIKDSVLELELMKKEVLRIEELIKKTKLEKKNFEELKNELEKESKRKAKLLREKEKEEKKLKEKFSRLLMRKNKLQELKREKEMKVREKEIKAREIENEINELNILKAKLNAELEVMLEESKEYEDLKESVTEIKESKNELKERIARNERKLLEIGSVNLRALEVYEKVKAEYESIVEKVNKLEEEKEEILKVIRTIDRKKKQAFMQTFNEINKNFSKNFTMLDGKNREAFMRLENKEDPFAGGIEIVIKLGKGKYMDAESLSGGEKVLTALALILAIQKYKPYCFYIFDEVDPALDKRNSERFAFMLRESVKNSQCIIITHNDAVISQADTLYGASMQDGVSKVISLKL